MATKSKKSPADLQSSNLGDQHTLETLKEKIAHIQGELESERKMVKSLRREKSYDVQHVRDLEQTKATVALKDLRSKLHAEKSKELELIKDNINKKCDLDVQVLTRQKDAELNKLRTDLRKCQDEVQQMREQKMNNSKHGLSGASARGTFDIERSKLLHEIQELGANKRQLERELKDSIEAEKLKTQEVLRLQDLLKSEVSKAKKDADVEIRKLLDELKSKDRLVWQMEKDQGARSDYSAATKLLLETPSKSTTSGMTDVAIMTEFLCQCQKQMKDNIEESCDTKDLSTENKDDDVTLKEQTAELSNTVTELQRKYCSVTREKTDLEDKLKDVDQKNRTIMEKNKKFLDKNIEVTNINRDLVENIKTLKDQISKLKSQSEKSNEERNKLTTQLTTEKSEKLVLDCIKQELDELKQQEDDQENTISVLKMACAEKDRRIELLLHKRRKRKNSRALQKVVRFLLPAKSQIWADGIRETYFGYDEDSTSLDSSEMSSEASGLSSSHLGLDTSNEEDEVFEDQVARDELENNFQRLMKEHLELEKSHALLQAQVGQSHLDPQRDSKDTGWLDEKETFNKTIRMLKDKVKNQEHHEGRQSLRIKESQEENEELEFRILELEEINEKLKEEANDTITIKEPPMMTDEGVLQMFAEEKGHMEIKLETLKERLHDLKYAKDGQLDKSEKLVLLQARAMLGIADKRLKELTTNQIVLKEKIKTLESEKVELLSAATGVSPELVVVHEATRKQLEDAEQKIKELEASVESYKKAEAVQKYKEDHNLAIETQHKEEILALKRKVRNSEGGRDYESELWEHNQDRIKDLERNGLKLQEEIAKLCQKVTHLQSDNVTVRHENSDLQQVCRHLQDTQELAESDKEANTLVHSLQCKLSDSERTTTSFMEKSETLQMEVSSLKNKLTESEKLESEMTEKLVCVQDQLRMSQDKCCHLQEKIESTSEEFDRIKGMLGNKAELLANLETQVKSLNKDKVSATEQTDVLTKSNAELEQQVKEKQNDTETVEKLTKQITELEIARNKLETITNDHKSRTAELESKLSEIETYNRNLQDKNGELNKELELSSKVQKDAANQVAQLNSQNQNLIEKVKSLDTKLKEARDNEVQTRDQLALIEEEKSRRIQTLEEQVDKMDEHEQRLSETIVEMEEVEEVLRNQLHELESSANTSLDSQQLTFDSQQETLNTSMNTSADEEIMKLRNSEQNLTDQVEQMEQNEMLLRARMSELESQLEEYEEKNSQSTLHREKIETLEHRLQELVTRESELLEQVYSMKLENQELQEHIDDLVSKSEVSTPRGSARGSSISEEDLDHLKQQVEDLEKDKSELRDQLLKAKLTAMETIQEEDEMSKYSDTSSHIIELEESEQKLKKDLEQTENKNKYLQQKVSNLEESESKLMEQIEFLEENGQKLNREIKKLRDSASVTPENTGSHVWLSKVKALEIKEVELVNTIEDMEQLNSSMKIKMNQYENTQTDEMKNLKEKVEILVNTEEKLLDRLQEQEAVEEQLKREINEYKMEINDHKVQLVKYKTESKGLKEQLTMERNSSLDNNNRGEGLEKQIHQMTEKENVLKLKITELEKSDAVLRSQMTGVENNVQQKNVIETDLRDKLQTTRDLQSDLKGRLAEFEKNNIALRTKLTALEAQKQDLLDTIKESTQKTKVHNGADVHANVSNTISGPAQTKTDKRTGAKKDDLELNTSMNQSRSMNGSLLSLTPTAIEELLEMPRDEMISRIHELESMEQFHMEKIKELSDNLSTFRQAVEVVAVTMETDSDIPLLNYKPKLRDAEFEARVQELVKTEVTLKLKNLELEKKEAVLRSQLKEAEAALKQQTKEYKAELEDLEAELDHVRRNEAKLKNKLQYGGWSPDNQALAKIQHLEDLVFELETSERKLKRQFQEAQDTEQDLREKIARNEQASQSHPILSHLKSIKDQEKFYEILSQVKFLESSEKDLKDELVLMKNHDVNLTLQQKVSDLERSERGLQRKLNLLEAQEATMNFAEDQEPLMLDSPEAILRQRIREQEKMEKYLKQQVIELEKDREELHEIARKDKSVIHELNIQVRSLQLAEKNLKEQNNQLEASESMLHVKVDDMTDRVEELENLVKKLQSTERHLKAQLQKFEYNETSSKAQVENLKEDLEKAEMRHKKKTAEMLEVRQGLLSKADNATDRVGDLEGIEISLKQKLRNLENSEVSLKDKVNELEKSEKDARLRSTELENINETLSQRIHTLQEEKSSLVFEMSDLEMLCSEHSDDRNKLNSTIKSLKDNIKEHENKKDNLQKRLDEFTDKEVTMQSKLQEHEEGGNKLHQKVNSLEQENNKLKSTLHELKGDLVSTESKLSTRGALERENTFLQGQCEKHLKNLQQTEQDNTKLAEKLRFYENSATDGSMATVPKIELIGLRAQAKSLEEVNQKLTKLEKSEANLKETILKLRQGKDSCGHESELAEMKRELNKYNAALQAHEMLKMNHENMKKELKQLQDQISNGTVQVRDRAFTLSKSVQVKLADSYTLHHITPDDLFYHLENKEEFKTALKNLGARHPEAYQDFVRALQPREGKQLSLVKVPGNEASPIAPSGNYTPLSSTPIQAKLLRSPSKMEDSGINEDIISTPDDAKSLPPGTASAQGGIPPKSNKTTDKEEIDDVTRKNLIRQLVDSLPTDEFREEDPLWQHVEDQDPELREKPYWNRVEGKPTDDMTLTVDVWGITDESGSEAGISTPRRPKRNMSARSTCSIISQESDSSIPAPPLPNSAPPTLPHHVDTPSNGLYYLPSSHHTNDSADEASEIEDEDDGAIPLKTHYHGPRAKSLDRDSDFSEGSFLASGTEASMRGKRKTGRHLRVIGSLESIPDSGTGSLRQDETIKLLKDKITSLEKQLKISGQDESSVLQTKTHETQRLNEEITSMTKTLQITRTKLTQAEEKSTYLSTQITQLQAENKTLQEQHKDLTQNLQKLEQVEEEKACLEKIILKLRGQLKDYDRIDMERIDMEKKTKALEEELRKKAQGESHLTQENARMRHQMDSLTRENKHLQVLERDYSIVRTKYNDMEQTKSKALTMITPLRSKVLRFASKCKSKDDLISRLAKELRQTGEHSSVLTEADKVCTHEASEEYNRPISPVTTQTLQAFEKDLRSSEVGQIKPANSKHIPFSHTPLSTSFSLSSSPPGGQSSSSDIDALLDQDIMHGKISSQLNRGPPTKTAKLTNTGYQRSHSADELDELVPNNKVTIDDFVRNPAMLSLKPVTQIQNINIVEKNHNRNRTGKPLTPGSQTERVPEAKIFRVIKDYDPQYFSTSGHQRLELSLREGDIVHVQGPPDLKGYYEGEVDGRIGLVPALYLQPLNSGTTRNTSRPKQPPSSHADSSPEQILALHQQLSRSHVPNHTVPYSSHTTSPTPVYPNRQNPGPTSSLLNHPAFVKSPVVSVLSPRSPRTVAHPAYLQGNQSGDQTLTNGMAHISPPDPPTNFCIQRRVGNHSIILSWTPPVMDELARSNGIVVRGYKIYINGRDKQTIPSPHMSKALIEKLNLQKASTFSIQTAAENGLLSRLVEAIYDESIGGHVTTETEPTAAAGDGDVSSVMSSAHCDDGEKRVFLAVYDYNPSQHSPHHFPAQELPFKTGDIIITYGDVREDGFYIGKVNGKKGLIAASFIEEVALLRSRGRRSISSSVSLPSTLFSPTSSLASINRLSSPTPDPSRPSSSQSGRSVTDQSRPSSCQSGRSLLDQSRPSSSQSLRSQFINNKSLQSNPVSPANM